VCLADQLATQVKAAPLEHRLHFVANGAYYVFRLDSLLPAGVPRFEEAQAEAHRAAMAAKAREAAAQVAQEAERRLNQGQTLEQVGQALGLQVLTLGPFTRTGQVPVLGSATPAIGAAFRLRPGERSGVLSNDMAYFILQADRRIAADSAAWRAGLNDQRAQIIRLARQVRVQSYLQALQRDANVRDRRAEVLRPQGPAQAEQTASR